MPLSYTIPSVDNIQEYYTLDYNFDMSDTGWDYNLGISWNAEEEIIDKIMINEVYTDPSIKANWLWLEEIKKLCDYKLGDEIWILTKKTATDILIAGSIKKILKQMVILTFILIRKVIVLIKK